MNSLPASTLIAEALAELERTARASGNTAGVNACNQATRQLLKGVEVLVDPSCGDLLVPSKSDGGTVYRVKADLGCSCKGAEKGGQCWHAWLADAIALARDLAVAGLDDDADAAAVAAFAGYTPADAFDPAIDADARYAETLGLINDLFPPRG